MRNSTDFTAWLKELAGADTQKTISQKSGVKESTLSRQLSRGTFRPEMVIALCRGYNHSPVTGLIETGYLNEWETDGVGIPFALRKASNQQLLDEIMRRSDPEALYLFGDPTGEAIDYENVDAPVTNLDAHRSNTQSVLTDTHLDYVAKRGTPEPEEGDDDYGDGA
ncbi:hypothetical protein ACOJA0_03455 [Corynebacterium amycolatum]|uniref:hypothetical protein n=1 Tax=Corynebacterium amycolatum TaxID=43765 RepID=UPI003B5C1A5E